MALQGLGVRTGALLLGLVKKGVGGVGEYFLSALLLSSQPHLPHAENPKDQCVPMPPHTHPSMTESPGNFATLWLWKPTLDFSHSIAPSYFRFLFICSTDKILQSLEGAFWAISWTCYGCILIFSLISHGWFYQRGQWSMRQPKIWDLETLTYRVTKLVSSKTRNHFLY